MITKNFSFTRYLSAKKSVDDRALNRGVWSALADNLPSFSQIQPLEVIEIGAGIGTMIERMVDWDLLKFANYTAIDAQTEVFDCARQRLPAWSDARGLQTKGTQPGLLLYGDEIQIDIQLEAIDLHDFLAQHQGRQTWNVLVAHAFLDLVDIPSVLPKLLELCKVDGIFYFSLNYDGLTVLEPTIDMEFDTLILDLYNQTMDNRLIAGQKSGDSRTGRHLFSQLANTGATVVAAGSSDWVVHPGQDGYPQDEKYFLHYIINTIYRALRSHPSLEIDRFEKWVEGRHSQIERRELVYIAHQIDFLGKFNT